MTITIEPIELGNQQGLKKFLAFGINHYKGNPYYVPPLKAEMLGNKLFGVKGIMTAEHPFHKNAEVMHWLARKNGKPVGRIAAAINENFNRYHKQKIGNFGFFESIQDEEVSGMLLNTAADWIKAKGMEIMRGPGNYSNATHDYQGCLIDNFHDYPVVENLYNHWYYAHLFEAFGCKKVKDYYAMQLPSKNPYTVREANAMGFVKKKTKAETRGLDMSKLESEVALIADIYNQAWSENWGFLPLSYDDIDIIAETFKTVAIPKLVRFAMIDGKEVAVTGFLPDVFQLFQKRYYPFGNSDILRFIRLLTMKSKIRRFKFFILGVVPEHKNRGLDALIVFEVREELAKISDEPLMVDASLLLEDNHPVINLVQRRGLGHVYKTFRIYDYEL